MNLFLYTNLSIKKKNYVNMIIFLLAKIAIIELGDLRRVISAKGYQYDYKTIRTFTGNYYFNLINDGDKKYITLGQNAFELLKFCRIEFVNSTMYATESFNKILTFEKYFQNFDFKLIDDSVAIRKNEVFYFDNENLSEKLPEKTLARFEAKQLTVENILSEHAEYDDRYQHQNMN